jgi:DNA-binding YbaB/EbfC family protein
MNVSDMMNLLKNQQAIQEKAKELQARTAAIQETGQAGAGMVKVTLSGTLEMVDCWISPDLAATGDRDMIQDLVKAAHHDAAEKVRQAVQAEMTSLLASMGLPPGAFGPGTPFAGTPFSGTPFGGPGGSFGGAPFGSGGPFNGPVGSPFGNQ